MQPPLAEHPAARASATPRLSGQAAGHAATSQPAGPAATSQAAGHAATSQPARTRQAGGSAAARAMARLVGRLSVPAKLAAASCAFAVPIAFVVWSLIAQMTVAITFVTPEIAGAQYLADLLAVQQQAAMLATRPDPSAATLSALADRVAAIQAKDGAILDSKAQAQAVIDSLHAPNGLGVARARLRDLIARVGDRSNLILDNVLGSYYLTDVVLNRLPDALDNVADSSRSQHSPATDTDARATFLMGLGTLTADRDGMDASLASAEGAQGGEAMKQALDASYLPLRHDFGVLLDHLRAGNATAAKVEALSAALAQFGTRSAVYLHGMLAGRLAGLHRDAWRTLAVTAVLFLLAAGIMAASIITGVTGPLGRLTRATRELADGNVEAALPEFASADELGAMAAALATFQFNARERTRLAQEADSARAAQSRQSAARASYTKAFGESIAAVLETLGNAAGIMRDSASNMAGAVEQTRSGSELTAEGAETSSRNLSTVAAATEQLMTSAEEIARQVEQVAAAARQAVQRALDTGRTVDSLSEAAGEIGTVVALIERIAAQTNLLALNATIEAARAGEAGRGFAVVASEVKQLAAHTARATTEIRAQIGTMQTATAAASQAVRAVNDAIAEVDQVALTIAGVVREQGGATREIVASVQEVSRQTDTATRAMREVSGVAQGASASSKAVLDTSAELELTSGTLRNQVRDFLATLDTPQDERRLFERVGGHGAKIRVTAAAGADLEATLADISLGGAAFITSLPLVRGDEIQLDLPGRAGRIPGRIVRASGGTLGVVFPTDHAAMDQVARAMVALGAHRAAA